jgi:hypothetical protein
VPDAGTYNALFAGIVAAMRSSSSGNARGAAAGGEAAAAQEEGQEQQPRAQEEEGEEDEMAHRFLAMRERYVSGALPISAATWAITTEGLAKVCFFMVFGSTQEGEGVVWLWLLIVPAVHSVCFACAVHVHGGETDSAERTNSTP